MSIERRPSNEQAHASSEQAGKILDRLDTMLSYISYRGNLKHYANLKEGLDIRLFSIGLPVEEDKGCLTLASILFMNKNDGYISYALYEVEKSLSNEELQLRQTFIGSPDEQLPPFNNESSLEYRRRQRLEHRGSHESVASGGTAEMIIDWLEQRNLSNLNGQKF